MKSRINNFLLGSRRTQFLIIFVVTFLFKLLFAWRSGITRGWQDELSWNNLAQTKGFFATVTEFDAGYPTPLLRTFSFAITQVSHSNFLFWHICVLIVISGSLASITFSRILSTKSKYLMAGLVCSYPSFDLLLLHNLSYWAFIPLFVTLSNILYGKLKINPTKLYSILALLFLAAKPQILLIVLVLIVSFGFISKLSHVSISIISFTILFLLIVGRFSEKPISLSFDLQSILNLITLNSHLLNIIGLLLIIAVYKAGKIFDQALLIGVYYLFASFLCSYFLQKFLRKNRQDVATFSVFVSLVIYISSLYFFPNSGWSNDKLLTAFDFISLYSRHYLPIVVIGSFLLIMLFEKVRLLNTLLLVGLFQNIVLQITLFNQFYHPS